jgi:hypothetical protein
MVPLFTEADEIGGNGSNMVVKEGEREREVIGVQKAPALVLKVTFRVHSGPGKQSERGRPTRRSTMTRMCPSQLT